MRCLWLVGLIALSACAIARVDAPDRAAIPSGEPTSGGPDPIGPITVLGSGRTFDVGWRYVAFDSADGPCTQLELVALTSTGCGPGMDDGQSVFLMVGYATLEGTMAADGLVSHEVAEVVVRTSDGLAVPVTLMSGGPAGLDGQAFVGFAPEGGTIRSVVALDDAGEVLETYTVPNAGS